MIRLFSILILSLIFSSCDNDVHIEGYWSLDNSEQTENPFFPYAFYANKDTIAFVDGNLFKQNAVFRQRKDSIDLVFPNGISSKYSISQESDTTLLFANKKFVKHTKDGYTKDDYPKVKAYELLGYEGGILMNEHKNGWLIHLIKPADTAKLILNDQILDFASIPEFLIGHDTSPFITLYIGKEIELRDLTEVYFWLKLCGVVNVELVVNNHSFEQFFALNDLVRLDESLINEFVEALNIPPFPPKADVSNIKHIDLYETADFKQLAVLSDSEPCLIRISETLDIEAYLELIALLNAKGNRAIKKEIMRAKKSH